MEKHGYRGIGMEGFIARWYDKNARTNSMDQYRAWAGRLEETISRESSILEVAPGPGYLSIELARRGFTRITGLDISETFIEIAGENAKRAGVNIEFTRGDASRMPFDDETFEHVICTAAFKNFRKPLEALREIHRVLVPGGSVWIADMRRDTTNDEINEYVDTVMKARGPNARIMKLTFRCMLRNRAYTADQFAELALQSGFGDYSIQKAPLGLELTLRK